MTDGPFYLNHFIIMIIVATQVSWICSELLIEWEIEVKNSIDVEK